MRACCVGLVSLCQHAATAAEILGASSAVLPVLTTPSSDLHMCSA